MFSPYYAWSIRRGRADPLDHVALNVALYGPRGKRWALTERGRARLARGATWLAIGPSDLIWGDNGLTIRFDEIAVPWPTRIRGTLRLTPASVETQSWPLDAHGRHRWSPIAPCAHADVTLQHPGLRWSGAAYFDSNAGSRPLAQDFVCWDWSRLHHPDGTDLLYEATRRDGAVTSLALRAHPAGGIAEQPLPPLSRLPRTRWGVARATRSATPARILRTLEDTPFYARSLLALDGQATPALHESLSLDRFRSPLVQLMLPFRMPRRGGKTESASF